MRIGEFEENDRHHIYQQQQWNVADDDIDDPVYRVNMPQHYWQEDVGTSSVFENPSMSILDRIIQFLKDRQYGIVVAVSVIGIMRFQGIIQNWFRKRVDLIQADNHDSDVRGVRLVWDIILNSIENAIEYGRWALHMIFLEPWRRIVIEVEDVPRNRVNSLPELLDSGYGMHASGCSSSCSSLHFGDDVLPATNMDPYQPHGADVIKPMSKTFIQMEDEGYEWVTKPLPPAFLHSNEYPLEWLVYHPMLGVILRRKMEEKEIDETGRQQETTIPPAEDNEDDEEKKCDCIPSITDNGEQPLDQQWDCTEPPPRQNDVPEHQPEECRSIPVAHSMPVLRSTVIT